MQERKTLIYPFGGQLVRFGHKNREKWLFENNSFFEIKFHIDISHRDEEALDIIMDKNEDIIVKDVGKDYF